MRTQVNTEQRQMNRGRFGVPLLIMLLLVQPCSASVDVEEEFSQGMTTLRWVPFPHFNQDNLYATMTAEEKTTGSDGGIGVLTNENAGGFASLSYAVTDQVSNFIVEAAIWCPVSRTKKGTLSGIAFLVDPIAGNFYRLVCNFNSSDPSVNIAFVGNMTNNFPVYLGVWGPDSIPGGLPEKAGWQTLSVVVQDGEATAFWNGLLLPGKKIPVDQIPRGFVGIYANYVGGRGAAETRVDRLRIQSIE